MNKNKAEHDTTTYQRIIDSATEEFLRLGYKDASLRNIVKTAGLTTGAFYGYFPDKEALFTAIVEPAASELKRRFIKEQEDFKTKSPKQQEQDVFKSPKPFLNWLVDYVYEEFTSFKLIICCAEGTPYADFVETFISIEVENTLDFINQLNKIRKTQITIKPEFIHIISSALFHAIFETISHNMSKEDAREHVNNLADFFSYGWKGIWDI
ncbi:MAG: TetR/AcrR family transcriptional regulator [Spirochaetales bacterium]|nr:TetR/AcrR family transcriptional regulator [Spirochaetales bacterium]